MNEYQERIDNSVISEHGGFDNAKAFLDKLKKAVDVDKLAHGTQQEQTLNLQLHLEALRLGNALKSYCRENKIYQEGDIVLIVNHNLASSKLYAVSDPINENTVGIMPLSHRDGSPMPQFANSASPHFIRHATDDEIYNFLTAVSRRHASQLHR